MNNIRLLTYSLLFKESANPWRVNFDGQGGEW